MKTFTTATADLDRLEIQASALEVHIQAQEGLTEATIELTGPDEILAEASVERTATRWVLTVPDPEPTIVSGNGAVVMTGNINGSVVMTSSGDVQVSGGRVTNTVLSAGAGEPVRATIHVPVGTDLYVPRLHTGHLRARGTYGEVDFRSTNADLDLDSARELEADTTNGSITCGSTSELIDVSTTNGNVTTGSAPRLRAKATNGDIRVLVFGDHRIRARTTNGDIDVTRNGHDGAEISTSTANGHERVR